MRAREEQASKEKELSKAFGLISSFLSKNCKKWLQSFLCQKTFPPCDVYRKPRPLRPCKKDCLALKSNVCKKEESQVERFRSALIPSCNNLPEMGSSRMKCNDLGIPGKICAWDGRDSTCIVSKGINCLYSSICLQD